MKICEKCGKELVDEVCSCKHAGNKRKKQIKDWLLVILLLVLFLWGINFFYDNYFKPKECIGFNGEDLFPKGCEVPKDGVS